MKIAIPLLLILLSPALTSAQRGGIGVQPRSDLVMLGAVERDSVADEIFSHIIALKRYAETHQVDSAALIIGFLGNKTDSMKWTRTVNLQNPDEKSYVESLLEKANKLFKASPESHREYFAVFKDKATPGGRKYLYQITQSDGKHKRMVSWNFYGFGDKLMLGDFN